MNEKPEYVMVIKRDHLQSIGIFQGIEFNIEPYLHLISKKHTYLLRSDAENNYEYKQIIPYSILHFEKEVLSYRRGKLLSEDRLIGMFSIGVGGHVSNYDQNLFNLTFEEAMRREIHEEINVGNSYDSKAMALINDETNDVGKVHLGLIYSIKLNTNEVTKKEKSINKPEFVSIESLKSNINKFENWSQICINYIDQLIH